MNAKMLSQLLLVFGFAVSLEAAAAEAAGRVLVAVGDVFAVRGGKEIRLSLGASVESGDLLRTGAASNAQVRMTDGAIMALRPQTELRLDEYHFDGRQDGAEKGFFSLVKGGFRTVTGLIGKANHDNYAVKTATATIGIRGTDYTVVICARGSAQACVNTDGSQARDGLYGGVTDGRINVANQGGDSDFGRSEAFYVADANTAPQPLIAPPGFLADRLEGQSRNRNAGGRDEGQGLQAALAGSAPASASGATPPAAGVDTLPNMPYVAAETLNAAGASTVLPAPAIVAAAPAPTTPTVPAAPTSTTALVLAYGSNVGANYAIGTGDTGAIDGGKLLSYSGTGPGGAESGQAGSGFANQGSAVVDGANVYWGRWTNGNVNSAYHAALTGATLPTGVHYMFGTVDTPDAVIAAKSGVVNYAFQSGTLSTDSAGNVGTAMAGNLSVNFTARTVAPDITYTVGGDAYHVTGFSMAITSGARFASNVTANNTGQCLGDACFGNPIDRVAMNGKFVGATGAGAIAAVSTFAADSGRSTAATGLFKAP